MSKVQMSELSVEEAITHIKAACNIAINAGYNSVVVDACAMAVEALRDERTGHWYKKPREVCYTCNKCGTTNASGVRYDYCPHCGAKMEVDNDERRDQTED